MPVDNRVATVQQNVGADVKRSVRDITPVRMYNYVVKRTGT